MIKNYERILELLAKIKMLKDKIYSNTLNDNDTRMVHDDIREYTKEVNKLLKSTENETDKSKN